MQGLVYLLPALAGLFNPLQSAANAGLNRALGQPVMVGFIVYLVGMLAILACAPFLGLSLRDVAGLRPATFPWWVWIGGLCNALFVMSAAIATPQLGAATITVLTSCLAIAASILLDHFGWFGLQAHPANALRLLGGAMAIGGIILVSRF